MKEHNNIQEDCHSTKMEHTPLLINDNNTRIIHPPQENKTRLRSLDVFRGLTMVGMILVDNQGSPLHLYPPVAETKWNGLSSADFVFPFFLFIAGFSIALALKNMKTSDGSAWLRIIKRCLILFFLGLFFNILGSDFRVFTHVRIPGVLQRIAFCYFATVVLFLTLPVMLQRVAALALIGTYLSLMLGLNVPGCGRGKLTPACNAGSYIDRKLFDTNMIHPNDPEGSISSLTAIVTVYLGLEFGRVLAIYGKQQKPYKLIIIWSIMTFALIAASIPISFWLPYNKKIWSLSFTLVTAGAGGFFLVALYYLIDVSPVGKNFIVSKSIQPLQWLGMNPIAIFALMVLFEIILMDLVHWKADGVKVSLWQYLFANAFATWLPKKLASFVMSLVTLVIFTSIAYILFRKKIFIKI